ncbi:MAG: DNA methyltransferase [Bacteroidetes bacterium]|nr:DNA methyltransferase [Bacteroidota bacterium]
MEQWDDQSVDLIYLDPPFNSKANYNQLFHTDGAGDAQFRAFTDTWTWDHAAAERLRMYINAPGLRAHDAICGLDRVLGPCGMLAYLTYMAERLEHCWRLLKDTGSIYLHCDPTASQYIRRRMDIRCRGGGVFEMKLYGVIHPVAKVLNLVFIVNMIRFYFIVNPKYRFLIVLFVI